MTVTDAFLCALLVAVAGCAGSAASATDAGRGHGDSAVRAHDGASSQDATGHDVHSTGPHDAGTPDGRIRESGAPDVAARDAGGETPMNAYAFVNALGVNVHFDESDPDAGIYAQRTQPSADGGVPAYQDLQALGVAHVRSALGKVATQTEARFVALHAHYHGISGAPITTLAVANPSEFPTQADLYAPLVAAGDAIDILEPCNEPNLQLGVGWEPIAATYQKDVFGWIYDGGYDGAAVAVSISALGGFPDLASYVDASYAFEGQGPWGVYQSVHSYPVNRAPDGGEAVTYALPSSGNLRTEVEERTVWCNPGSAGLTCPPSFPRAIASETGYCTCNTVSGPKCVSASGGAVTNGISETAQAKYLPRLFVDTLAGGVSRVYFYELYDQGPPASPVNQDHFGIMRADGTPKPAFQRLQLLLATTAASSAGTVEPLPVSVTPTHLRHLLLQNGVSHDYYLLLWNDIPSYDFTGQKYADAGCDGGASSGCDIVSSDEQATVSLGAGAPSFSTATVTYLEPGHRPQGCSATFTPPSFSASSPGSTWTVCVPDEVTIVTLH